MNSRRKPQKSQKEERKTKKFGEAFKKLEKKKGKFWSSFFEKLAFDHKK